MRLEPRPKYLTRPWLANHLLKNSHTLELKTLYGWAIHGALSVLYGLFGAVAAAYYLFGGYQNAKPVMIVCFIVSSFSLLFGWSKTIHINRKRDVRTLELWVTRFFFFKSRYIQRNLEQLSSISWPEMEGYYDIIFKFKDGEALPFLGEQSVVNFGENILQECISLAKHFLDMHDEEDIWAPVLSLPMDSDVSEQTDDQVAMSEIMLHGYELDGDAPSMPQLSVSYDPIGPDLSNLLPQQFDNPFSRILEIERTERLPTPPVFENPRTPEEKEINLMYKAERLSWKVHHRELQIKKDMAAREVRRRHHKPVKPLDYAAVLRKHKELHPPKPFTPEQEAHRAWLRSGAKAAPLPIVPNSPSARVQRKRRALEEYQRMRNKLPMAEIPKTAKALAFFMLGIPEGPQVDPLYFEEDRPGVIPNIFGSDASETDLRLSTASAKSSETEYDTDTDSSEPRLLTWDEPPKPYYTRHQF